MSNWTYVDNIRDASDQVGGTNVLSLGPLSFAPVAGNVSILSVTFFDGTGTPPTINSIQDENGKTYTVSTNSPAPDTAHLTGMTFLAYMIVPSGAGQTISITFSKNFTNCIAHYDEFNLSVGTPTFDSDAVSIDGVSGSTATTPTVPVNSSDDLIFGHVAASTSVNSVNTPWVAAGIQDAFGGFNGYVLGASSGTAFNWTLSSSGVYSAIGMSFKAASGVSRPMFRGH